MKPLIKKIEVRWSDLDPNRHLANSAYSEFMSHARISFLAEAGFGQEEMHAISIGPVILSEEFHYLKEIKPNESVFIEIELLGNSDNWRYSRFGQSLFSESGALSAYHIVTFGWMDLNARKIRLPPQELIDAMKQLPRAGKYHLLNSEDIRRSDLIPRDKSLNTNTMEVLNVRP